ncbi:MAG: HAMP domain-containing sensor histidine kinase [Bacillota bacterium]|nr:HAMP domain-containing sensor histidine kinase [Bacillota bacterium]
MNSIFRKFSFVYLLLFLLSFILIVVGVRIALENYFIEKETGQIRARIGNYETLLNASYVDRISLSLVKEQVLLLDSYSGGTIWLVDEEGGIYGTDQDLGSLTESDVERLHADWQNVREGGVTKTLVNEGVNRERMLRVGVPLRVGEQRFSIFVSLPMLEIADTITRVSLIVFVSLVLVAFLALVSIYLLTNRMTSEIRAIAVSADKIAKGQLDQRIKGRKNGTDELAELADAFNKMANDIQKQERARRNFVSSFSHDIRTPLTTIKGYTAGILDGTIDREKQDRYLGIVVSECDRMLTMSNNLLDLAKMESGELVLSKTDFDLNQLILTVLDSFETIILEKQVKLNIDLHREHVLAHGDVNGIQRIVYNLLDNATKFVDVGGAISIRTELKNEKFYVGISNTGKVMTPEERARIWNRFEKLDASRGLEKRSSGLGLSIVREIINAHNETIEVYSNEDIGVAFIFTIPVQIFKKASNHHEANT